MRPVRTTSTRPWCAEIEANQQQQMLEFFTNVTKQLSGVVTEARHAEVSGAVGGT